MVQMQEDKRYIDIFSLLDEGLKKYLIHIVEDALQKTYKQTKINVDTIIKMWYLIYKEKHN